MENKPLKFFFALPTGVLGGAERIVFNLVMMLLEDGYSVTVYIMSRGYQDGWEVLSKYENLNLIVKNYKSEKTSLPIFLFNLFYLSYKFNYDYSFSSHTHVNGVLSFMRKIKLFKTKYLISRESTFIFERYFGVWRYIFKFIYKFMYGSQDLLICQTENMKLSLINNLGYKPVEKIEVIPNFVNLSFISQQLSNSILDDKPFPFLIVACGRLIPLKNFDKLIKAFSLIHKDFPDAGLVIIGDGPEREKLKELLLTESLCKKVILTGKVNNPIQWFELADLGIISSEIEGFPNVVLEMMAAGTKNIVSTPCTDGVFKLPHVEVTQDSSVEDLKEIMKISLNKKLNNANIYREYIQKFRSANSFWVMAKDMSQK